MKKLSTYLLIFFMVMFWGFRIVLAFTNSIGTDIGFTVSNINLEIVLLFVTLVLIVLVIKRKVIGALLYLLIYGAYFGPTLINLCMVLAEGSATIVTYSDLMASFIGIVIPICVLFDLLLDKNRKAHPKDKKTDWFYKNEQYDRKLDERADKNNYRTL